MFCLWYVIYIYIDLNAWFCIYLSLSLSLKRFSLNISAQQTSSFTKQKHRIGILKNTYRCSKNIIIFLFLISKNRFATPNSHSTHTYKLIMLFHHFCSIFLYLFLRYFVVFSSISKTTTTTTKKRVIRLVILRIIIMHLHSSYSCKLCWRSISSISNLAFLFFFHRIAYHPFPLTYKHYLNSFIENTVKILWKNYKQTKNT